MSRDAEGRRIPFRGSVPPAEVRRGHDPAARREESPDSLPEAPPCPFCQGTETDLMSPFGSHASVSTYWCRACRSPFELMRWR